MTFLLGVLGGMGPYTTLDFLAKLLDATAADHDQEHLPVVVWSDPRVPDRTAAVLGAGPDPTPVMVDGATRLVEAGATVLAMPCNTAHAFLPALRVAVDIPVLDMVEEAVAHLRAVHPAVRAVGVLGTTGTLAAGLYERQLHRWGMDAIRPHPELQESLVMAGIRRVKAGEPREQVRPQFVEAVSHLALRGAEAVLLACSEIPLVLRQLDVEVPLVDPTAVLAGCTVAAAREAGLGGGPVAPTCAQGSRRTNEVSQS